ncbi:hypothetical protein OROMI_009645 [Orobanche minor]
MGVFKKWANLPNHHVVKLRGDNSPRGVHYLHHLSVKDERLEDFSGQSLDLPFLEKSSSIAASSCGGLLYLEDDISGTVFLCNPTTRKYRSFPLGKDDGCFYAGALGYNDESNDYKMWKKIYSAPPCVPWGNHNMVYVSATGKSYWLAGDDAVLSFDFSSEEFDYFDLPSLPYFYCPLENLLVKLHGGLLGVVRHWVRGGESYGHYYELWVRREEVGEWVRMFDTVCLGGGAGRPIGLVDARFLLLKGIPDCDDASSVMLVYDWTTKKCVDNDPRLYMHEGLIDVLSYVEETTDVLQRESIRFDASLPRTSIQPMQRIPRKIKDIKGLDENTRGGKHEYRLIVDGEYKDWADNGFRVLNDYHPSKDRHVFMLDRGSHISVDLRSLNGLYDDRYDDGPYVYEDELYELNDDEVKIGDGLEIGDGLKIDGC